MAVDRESRLGSFLVTGSQTFSLMAGVSESLAGRPAIFSLHALSLREVATGAVSSLVLKRRV